MRRTRTLGPVRPAGSRTRILFDPARGPVRRTERRLSNFLHHAVWPRIPRLSRIYERQLRAGLTLVAGEIGIPGLPRGFDGMRLLLVTDVHAGPFLSPTILRRTFRELLRTSPELVLLGGDLVTRHTEELVRSRRAFAELRAPLGVHAVLGNHDHYTEEPDRVREELEDLGISVLHNRSVVLERGGDRLHLAGIDDLLLGRPDLDQALAGTEPPAILLSHNPDVLPAAADRGVALVLSGHTHGGQIRPPGGRVIVRQSRYCLDEGRYARGGTELFVSRGLGAIGLPFRFGCPPEAAMITLRSGPGPDRRTTARSIPPIG